MNIPISAKTRIASETAEAAGAAGAAGVMGVMGVVRNENTTCSAAHNRIYHQLMWGFQRRLPVAPRTGKLQRSSVATFLAVAARRRLPSSRQHARNCEG
jgi:hypothetical protein